MDKSTGYYNYAHQKFETNGGVMDEALKYGRILQMRYFDKFTGMIIISPFILGLIAIVFKAFDASLEFSDWGFLIFMSLIGAHYLITYGCMIAAYFLSEEQKARLDAWDRPSSLPQ